MLLVDVNEKYYAYLNNKEYISYGFTNDVAKHIDLIIKFVKNICSYVFNRFVDNIVVNKANTYKKSQMHYLKILLFFYVSDFNKSYIK